MNGRANPQLMVWWSLWVAFLVAIGCYYQFLGSTQAQSAPPVSDSSAWLAGLAPLLLSVLIRWLVLPHISTAGPALAVFAIGIALAEVCCFLGLFIFPAHKEALFVMSFIGVFQFMPFFASRFVQN